MNMVKTRSLGNDSVEPRASQGIKISQIEICGPYRDSFRTKSEQLRSLVCEVMRLAQAGWPANDNEPAEQRAA
jgi:hypothetical protein